MKYKLTLEKQKKEKKKEYLWTPSYIFLNANLHNYKSLKKKRTSTFENYKISYYSA